MADENTRSVDIRIGATPDTARGVAAATADLKSLTAAAARENRAMAADADRAASMIRAKATGVQDNKRLAGLEGPELTLAKAKLSLEKERTELQSLFKKSLSLPPEARTGLDAQLIELDRDLVARFDQIKKDVYQQFAQTKFVTPEIVPPKQAAPREPAGPRGTLGQPGNRPPIKIPVQAKDDTEEEGRGGVAGQLDQVKGAFGRGSLATGLARALAGGGAAIGIKLIASEIGAVADKVQNLREKWIEIPPVAGEVREELLNSIPIYGDIFEAGGKWRAQLDGTAAAIAKINVEAKHLAETTERTKAVKDSTREILDQSARRRIEDSQLAEPMKIRAVAELDFETSRKKIEDDKKKLSALVAAQSMSDSILGRDSAASKTFGNESRRLSAAINQEEQDRIDSKVLAAGRADEEQQRIDREQIKAAQDRERQIAAVQRDGARESQDIQDKISTDRLQKLGQGFEAEIALARRANERAKEDDLRQAKEHEQDTSLPLDVRAAAVPESRARNQLRDEELNRTLAQMRIQFAQQYGDIESRIASVRLRGMHEAIDAGNRLLAVDAARLEVVERFEQRRREVQAIIDDPKAGAGQKERARAEQKNLTPEKENAADLRATNNAQFDLIAEQGQLRASILEKEGDLGNRAAKIEADRLRIKLEYVRLGRQVVDQVQNETERTKILAKLAKDMRVDLDRAGVRAGESFASSTNATDAESHPDGTLLALREELTLKRDPVVEAVDKNSSITSGTNSLLDSIFGWLKLIAPKNEPAPKPVPAPAATPTAPEIAPPEVDKTAANAAKGFAGARNIRQAAQDQADEAEKDRPAREARARTGDEMAAEKIAATARANAENNAIAERERAARLEALFGDKPAHLPDQLPRDISKQEIRRDESPPTIPKPEPSAIVRPPIDTAADDAAHAARIKQDSAARFAEEKTQRNAEIKRKADDAKREFEDRTRGRISSTDRGFVDPLIDPPDSVMEGIGNKIRDRISGAFADAKRNSVDPLTDPDGNIEAIGNRRRAIPGSEMASADPSFAVSQAAQFAQQQPASTGEGDTGTQPLTEATGLLILEKLAKLEAIGKEMKKAVDPVKDIDDLLSNALSSSGDTLRV